MGIEDFSRGTRMKKDSLTLKLICPKCKKGRPLVRDTRYIKEFCIVKRVRVGSKCVAIFITTEKLTSY